MAKVQVLIAEDESIIRLDLRAMLERAGFDVCAEARDGQEAVELARARLPDLAILDVKMPRLDGIEAARQILAERLMPILMLTAYDDERLVDRAVEAGVFAYMVKPFRERDLLPAIRTALARYRDLVEHTGAEAQVQLDLPSGDAGATWPLTLVRHPDGSVDVGVRRDRDR